MTKTSLKLILPLLVLTFLIPLSAKAFAVKTGNAINIGANEIIDGNLYAAGSTLLIDGRIKGDVICAGQSVTINGQVDGDVLCAAQSINVLGEVTGSVRVAGNNINLNNKVGRNVMAFGASVVLGSNTQVGLDTFLASGFASINGKIGGSLHGSVNMITINGQIDKDVALNLDVDKDNRKLVGPMANLVVTENAKIGGNLEYASVAAATIVRADSIGGQVSRQLPKMTNQTFKENLFIGFAMMWLWCKIIALLGTLLIGLILVVCFKDKLLNLFDQMVVSPGLAIGWGALLLLITPFALIFLLMTIVGIPLAMLVGLLWLTAMMLGKILVMIFAGFVIMGRYRHKRAKNDAKKETTSIMILSMIVGVIISFTLFTIPIFGWLLAIIAQMWGFGALYLVGKKCYK